MFFLIEEYTWKAHNSIINPRIGVMQIVEKYIMKGKLS
jgi:hypothetical protein